MQHATIAFPDDAQATNHGLNPRSDLMYDPSTPPSDDPSGSVLSAGAIVGIVIGSIFGVVILIGVGFLVRHFFCRSPGSQIPTDKFTVSYTRTDLNASTFDRNASSSVDHQLGRGADFGGRGRDGVAASSASLPSFKVNGDTVDAPDGSDSYNAIEINFPDSDVSDEFSNQNSTVDNLPAQSSKIGIDNPCFDCEDDKPSFLSVPTPTKSQMPTISISQPNSRNNSPVSSTSKLSASYAQERGDFIRRSYHLDRNVASAIAAQRNRETTSVDDIFSGSEFPLNRNDDVIIVFTARTVL